MRRLRGSSSHKKTRAPCGGGLNPILRGDELEGEELQNSGARFPPPSFLHAVTSVAILQWTVGNLSGRPTVVLPLLISAQPTIQKLVIPLNVSIGAFLRKLQKFCVLICVLKILSVIERQGN